MKHRAIRLDHFKDFTYCNFGFQKLDATPRKYFPMKDNCVAIHSVLLEFVTVHWESGGGVQGMIISQDLMISLVRKIMPEKIIYGRNNVRSINKNAALFLSRTPKLRFQGCIMTDHQLALAGT